MDLGAKDRRPDDARRENTDTKSNNRCVREPNERGGKENKK